MLIIWAIAFGARKADNSVFGVGAVLARSKEEARGKALETAEASWPQCAGWFGYSGLAKEIPGEWLKSIEFVEG